MAVDRGSTRGVRERRVEEPVELGEAVGRPVDRGWLVRLCRFCLSGRLGKGELERNAVLRRARMGAIGGRLIVGTGRRARRAVPRL
eukprot:2406814-Alexandrium_andersonii.AAC.1